MEDIIRVINTYCKESGHPLTEGEIHNMCDGWKSLGVRVCEHKGYKNHTLIHMCEQDDDLMDYLYDTYDDMSFGWEDLWDYAFDPDGDFCPLYWFVNDTVWKFDLDEFRAEASLEGYGLKYERLTATQRCMYNDLRRMRYDT